MTVWAAFRDGLARIRQHKRLILWLYLVNVLFAAALIVPFRNILTKINKRDVADAFVAGFSFDAFVDVLAQYGSAFTIVGYAAVGLGVLYLLFNIFLTAGVVTTLALEAPMSLRQFCTGAAQYFWRYLRLLVLLVVVLGAIGWAFQSFVQESLDKREEAAISDVAALCWQMLGPAVLLLGASMILMVFDYAKIRMVLDQRRSALLASWASTGYCAGRPFGAALLFYLNAFLAVLLLVIYLAVENFFSNATLTSALCLFAVQQVFILGRIVIRLSFFASQMAYYQASAVDSEPSPSPATTTTPAPIA